MAVAFNAVTIGAGNSATPTRSHDPQGSDRFLIAALAQIDPLGLAQFGGITFGGSPMTELGAPQGAGGVGLRLFRKAAPPAGSALVVATFDTPVDYVLIVASYTGVSQSGPTGVVAQASGSGTAVECMAADTYDGSMVFDAVAVAGISASITASAHGGQVELAQANAGTGPNIVFLGSSDDIGGGLATMAWTLSQARAWVQKVVEVRPVIPGGSIGLRLGALIGRSLIRTRT